MAQGKATDRDKVARVLADLYLNAGTQEKIAEHHEVSPSTVTEIKRRYFEDFERLKNTSPQWGEIDSLVMNHIVRSVITSDIQLEHFGDASWLAQQSAGELATLYGVIDDKRVRLLGAMQNAQRVAETDVPRLEDPDEGQATGDVYAERGSREVS